MKAACTVLHITFRQNTKNLKVRKITLDHARRPDDGSYIHKEYQEELWILSFTSLG